MLANDHWKTLMSEAVSASRLLDIINLVEAGRFQFSIKKPVDKRRMEEDTAKRLFSDK